MSLRLVDNGNVIPLPGSEMCDMKASSQGFADAIADGSLNLRLALVVTVDEDGLVDFLCLGEQATTSEAVGLFELAKAKIVMGAFR